MAGFTEYADYDGLGLAALVSGGHVSAAELVEEAIARIEAVNSEINAVVHPLYERARAAARNELPDGPFRGVPMLLKDMIQTVEGVPTSWGSRFCRGWVADHDSELVRRYRGAGLVFVAKSNTPELGLRPVTEPQLCGPTRNPWDRHRVSGGSSGGSAAAVSAGMVPIAHGGDGAGSIRIPASCCGVFGFKPTRGRNPAGPDASERWNGFVQEHVLTRSVRDSAAMLDATGGPEPTSPYHAPPRLRPYSEEVERDPGRLRIAFHTEPPMPSTMHGDCLRAVQDAAALCDELGHHVEEVPPGHDAQHLVQAVLTVVCAHTAADIGEAERLVGRDASPRDFETETWLAAMLGRHLTAADYARAVRDLQAEARRLVEIYADWDVILTPTVGKPPLRVGEDGANGLEARLQRLIVAANLDAALKLPGLVRRASGRAFDFACFTPVANFTGQPSMSVPLHWNGEGLPVGVMFTGRFGDDATLFRLAAQLERARPWAARRPPLHVERHAAAAAPIRDPA